MTKKEILNADEVRSSLSQLPQWRYGLGTLRTVYKCPSSASALELLAAIGSLAEEANHHPDVDWRYDTLFVTLTSHDSGGVTTRDTLLAGRISEKAESLGAGADLNLVRSVEICIDTDNPSKFPVSGAPHWATVRSRMGAWSTRTVVARPFGSRKLRHPVTTACTLT